MELDETLKPCPFCGGKAKILIPHARFMLKKFHYHTVVVACTYCESMTKLFALDNQTGSQLFNEEHEKKAIHQAVNAWNKRDGEKEGGK